MLFVNFWFIFIVKRIKYWYTKYILEYFELLINLKILIKPIKGGLLNVQEV